MRREKTASFVVELPLVLTSQQTAIMRRRFDAGRQVYNACLGECLKRLTLMRESKQYQRALKLERGKERTQAFKAVNQKFGFEEYALHEYGAAIWHKWRTEDLDSLTVQTIATRAFKAVQQYAFGKRGKPRFKGVNQFDSLEGKTNTSGILWRENTVVWKGVKLEAKIDLRDDVIAYGLQQKVKYVRLVRRKLNGQVYYYVQLVCEGVPYQKARNQIGEGRVGLDLGPSTIAVVGEKEALYTQFCASLDAKQAEIRRLQRKLDRQRRANNPQNYQADGQIKTGKLKWRRSNRMRDTQRELAELHRTRAAQRASLHGALANDILEMGNVILLEKVSYRAWQKMFGKSVSMRAPGMFVELLKRKAVSAGVAVHDLSTRTTKLSQTCHCGRVKKKPLSLRVHACECGINAQRDLYSAFLACHVDPATQTLDANHAQAAWLGVDMLLRTASSGKRYAKLVRDVALSHPPDSKRRRDRTGRP
jgi:putative transposase